MVVVRASEDLLETQSITFVILGTCRHLKEFNKNNDKPNAGNTVYFP